MPETIIDFGGFTVDVSKIDWIDTAEVVPSLFVRIGNTGLWLGDNDAKTIKEAHEKHLAKVNRENLADGWYWASDARMRRSLIRVKNKLVSSVNPLASVDTTHITDTTWMVFEPADPLSLEFLMAVRGGR